MLTGQNGILTQSSNSKDKTNAAEVAERVNMELNAQLSRAMAGESFNTAEDIVKNIGTLPTGYTLTKDDITSSATKLSIEVKGTDVSKLAPAVATLTKDSTSGNWSVTSTVKAK